VDYDVIPINIVSGCLYNCRFCMVRSGEGISLKKPGEIKEQVRNLKKFYGKDLLNYNSLFLANHDGLYAGNDLVPFAAEYAYKTLEISGSFMNGAYMFLFGSIHSFLKSPQNVYESLNSLPYYTYINIGLESADDHTLKILGKPVSPGHVSEAFHKMIEINRRYPGIEVTANFLLSEKFSQDHTHSLIELCNSTLSNKYNKGALYLSPLDIDRCSVELQNSFKTIKRSVNLPAYIYLIQRL
jgi:tRNA A37 methylthiotransferase MiaB